ncbi:MAG: enoyl-CoA hydratase/isomerase family protein [Candidatus Stahlbacteria bacterium]|nr:enoyl-CoA hydratase/isomerase family protein [Candidatus Stahlbacteria bacterium]
MEYKHILVDKRDGVVKITLNRPPLNILNIEMMNEMNTVFDGLQKETLKLLVIQGGAPPQVKAFCAGVDVSEHTDDKVNEMMTTFHKMFKLLNSVPAVSIAVVNGVALGGGCELATFCDIVIASEIAKFGQPEIRVGVFAPVAAVILPHLIGRNRAIELLVTGNTIDGKEAERIGLINHCFAVDGFQNKVDEFISRIASMSASILQLTKRAVDKALYSSVVNSIEPIEELYLKELMNTEDVHEGLRAFLDKRIPKWSDR